MANPPNIPQRPRRDFPVSGPARPYKSGPPPVPRMQVRVQPTGPSTKPTGGVPPRVPRRQKVQAQVQQPVAYPISNFQGFNSFDPPLDLSPSVGTRCINFYFDKGKLYPRAGSSPVGAALATTSDAGFFVSEVAGTTHILSAHWDGTWQSIYNWNSGTATLETGADQLPGNSTTKVDFGRFGDWIIAGNGAMTHYRDPNTDSWKELKVESPVSAPTVADSGVAGVLNGTYQYYVVYYDPYRNAVSKPSPITSAVTVSGRQMSLTSIIPPSDSSWKTWIYRIGGASNTPRKVAEIGGSTTTYTDNISDDDLGDVMEEGNDPFPLSRYFDYYNGRLVGAWSLIDLDNPGVARDEFDYIYISYYGEPWRCPTVTDVDNPLDGARIQLSGDAGTEITGLKTFGEVLTVFTAREMYLLTGDEPSTFRLSRGFTIGCVAHRTIQQVGTVLVWLADKDVYAWDGQSQPMVVSKPIRDKIRGWTASEKAAATAFSYEGRYYLLCGGEVFFLDFTQSYGGDGGQVWAWGEIQGWTVTHCAVKGVVGSDQTIYGIDTSAHRVWTLETGSTDNGTPITVTWRSGYISPDRSRPNLVSRVRRFRSVFEQFPGSALDQRLITFTLYVDGNTTAVATMTPSYNATTVAADEPIQNYQTDVACEVEGEYHEVQLTSTVLANGSALHPVIHSIEPLLLPIRS